MNLKTTCVLMSALLILVIPVFNIAEAQTGTLPEKKTLTAGETWEIGSGYSLTAVSIDAKSSPRSVTVAFYKNGDLLDKKLISAGQIFSWKDVFFTKVDAVFAGATSDMVQFTDTSLRSEPVQASSSSGSKSLSVGESWDMGNGWVLTAQAIDAKATPRQVWFVLSRDGSNVDDKVLSEGQIYSWNNIFSTKISSIYPGTYSDMVSLTDTYLNQQTTTVPARTTITPPPTSTPYYTPTSSYLGSKSLTVGESWDMGNGLVLTAQAIDAKATPRQVWFVLSRDGSNVDDKVLSEGQIYSWNNIFSTRIGSIKSGTNSDEVYLTDTYMNQQTTTVPAQTAITPLPTSTPYYTPASTPRPDAVTNTKPEVKPSPREVVGDFSVSVSPTSVTVKPGDTLRFTLTVLPSGGFSEPVDIYVNIKALGQEKDLGRVKTFYPPYEPFVFESPVPNEIPQGATLTGYITARGGGREHDAGTVTVKVPGFEILPMIAAVGMAMFLIRRKK